MNSIENDMNLREVVSRREQRVSPIDDDLNELLKASLQTEGELCCSHSRRGLHTVVAHTA